MSADEKYFGIVSKELSIGRRDEALWTKAFALENGQESATKARYIRLRVEQLQAADQSRECPQEPQEAAVTSGMLWRRFWAKMVDLCIVQLVTIGCIVTISPQHPHPLLLTTAWLYVVFVVYDTLALYFFQTSLGRYLFSIEVYPVGEQPLKNTAQRTLSLLFMGLGGFVPIVNLFTQFFAYKRVRRTGEARWDAGKFEVAYGPGGVWKYTAAIVAILLLATFSKKLLTGFDEIAQYGPRAYETPEETARRQYEFFQIWPTNARNRQPATSGMFDDLPVTGGAPPQNQQPSTLPEGYVIDPPGGTTPQNQQPATGVFDPFAPAPAEPKEVTELRKAAAQGDAAAQSNLGLIYAIGRGVPANFIEAVKWLRLAAAQGDAAAQSNLGLVYESGQGVPKSKVVAYALFNLATSNDRNHTATDNRNGMSERMTAQEIEVAQALTREMAKPGNLLAALDNYVSRSR